MWVWVFAHPRALGTPLGPPSCQCLGDGWTVAPCCLALAVSSMFLLPLCLSEAASLNHFGHRLCTCAGGPLAEAFGFEFWAGCGADPGLCLLHGAKDRLSVMA